MLEFIKVSMGLLTGPYIHIDECEPLKSCDPDDRPPMPDPIYPCTPDGGPCGPDLPCNPEG